MRSDVPVAVVTGGGRGIGAAVARSLALSGARVVVTARSGAQIGHVAETLRHDGHEALALPCDVSDPESVHGFAESVRERMGPVDILVNNAGVGSSAPLRKLTLADWNRMMAVNATGTFLVTRAFLPAMVERGWGRVVNVASIAGLTGAPYISAYVASKHAQVGFTRALASEVAGSGVTVNAVCPGYVDTPMTDETVRIIMERTGRSEAQAREAVLAQTAGGRLITPEEVAHAVTLLCAPEAGGINGDCLVVDGGGLNR